MGAPTMCFRAEALASGQLLDVSETARAAQLNQPTAVTHAFWARFTAALPSGPARETQLKARLLGLLVSCRMALEDRPEAKQIGLICLMDKKLKPGVMPDLDGALHLKLVRGEGDQGEPVLTIVMDED